MSEKPEGCGSEYATVEDWPDCSVPDCEYKSCASLKSDKCYAHTLGLTPVPMDEYLRTGTSYRTN